MRGDQNSTARQIVERLSVRPPRLGSVQLVCVDGPAGSGKTSLAAVLAGELALTCATGVTVVHLDDLYDGWSGLDGSLWPRLDTQVLDPLRRGRSGRYQRYDWSAGRFDEWVDVPVSAVLILEGCGSARRAADPWASLRIWVEAPDDLRLARGLQRDGAEAREHWLAWMHDESRHFATEQTSQRADIRVDGFGRMRR